MVSDRTTVNVAQIARGLVFPLLRVVILAARDSCPNPLEGDSTQLGPKRYEDHDLIPACRQVRALILLAPTLTIPAHGGRQPRRHTATRAEAVGVRW